MIIWKDEYKLVDTDNYKLNFGLLSFNDYRTATQKIVKSESYAFNDSYVYRPETYQGYNTTLEFIVRDTKRKQILTYLRKGNRISLPYEKNYYREYYLEGETKITYYSEGYSKVSLGIYLNAFKYEILPKTYNILKGTIIKIYNTGSVYAEPVITVMGNGQLVFTINDVTHVLKNSNRGYIINCKNKEQEVTDLDYNARNVTSEYNGNFPKLLEGENRVQLITGDSMKIVVNWRELD